VFAPSEVVTREALYLMCLPLLVAIIEGLKAETGFNMPHRFAFPVALLLGVGVAFLAYAALPYPAQNWAQTTFQGIALGASASGVYSGGRSVLGVGPKPAPPPGQGPRREWGP
jgi:hypothetical protein